MKGGKTSGEPSGAGKIVDAARTLVAIERDMQEEAMDFHGHLSRFFSPAERRRIIAPCIDFMCAVAAAESAEDLVRARATLEALRDETLTTDRLIAEHTRLNPLTMNFVIETETTLSRLLANADPTVISFAGIAVAYRSLVDSFLTDRAAGLYALLLADEGVVTPFLARQWDAFLRRLLHPRGWFVGTLAKHFLAPLRKELRTTGARLRKDYAEAGQPDTGCHHPDRKKDVIVQRIITHLAAKGVTFSIHNACKVVAGECHTTLMPWLYSWCNDHKHKIREAVERAKSVSR